MELRNYLAVIRRQRWVVLTTIVLGLALTFALQSRVSPSYNASAELLLLPNDPAERVTDVPAGYFDPTRYAAAQVSIIKSPAVLKQVAPALGMTQDALLKAVEVTAGQDNDALTLTATAASPARSRDIANGLARGFITYRMQTSRASLQAAAAEIGVQLAALNERMTALQTRVTATGSGARAVADLQAVNVQYSTLFARQQDLLIDESLKKGEAQLVRPAELPGVPGGTPLRIALILGGLVAAMAGLGLAFLRDQFDDRIRSSEELEALTGMPVLAAIPEDRESSKWDNYLAAQAEPLGRLAEAVRSLRTNINFLAVEGPMNKLMVTSAQAGDGKTLVAANLAVTFAQAGVSTLLVSADLRRPRLGALFGVDEMAPGLSTILVDHRPSVRGASRNRPAAVASDGLLRALIDEAIVLTSVPQLSLLPAGPCPPNPAELLMSARMGLVLDLLEDAYDLVILDTSPLLPVTDAAALVPKVGTVLLVASASATRRRSVTRAQNILRPAKANVLGMVYNCARAERGALASYDDDDDSRGHHGRGAPARSRHRTYPRPPVSPSNDVAGPSSSVSVTR